MAKQVFSNYASCTLGAAIVTTGAIASITLQTGQGAEFPSPTSGDWFVLAIWKSDKSAFELFKITARSGDVLTVDSRAFDGTTAATWSTSDICLCVVNAGAMSDLQNLVTVHEAASPAHSAANISNSPAGNVSATTVQTAINELDTEKLDKSGGTMTGALSGTAITLSGALAAASAAITGAITAASATLSGALTAASAAISGALTAASATISGALSAATISENSTRVLSRNSISTTSAQSYNQTDEIKTFAHGLAGVPWFFAVFARCTSGDKGYSTGDIIPIANATSANEAVTVSVDATNVVVSIRGGIVAVNKNSSTYGVLTGGSWEILVKAHY